MPILMDRHAGVNHIQTRELEEPAATATAPFLKSTLISKSRAPSFFILKDLSLVLINQHISSQPGEILNHKMMVDYMHFKRVLFQDALVLFTLSTEENRKFT